MKDLTKAIDTLDSINKIMGCMKEHTHNGITITTVETEYRFDECGVALRAEVENKANPEYESSAHIYFSFLLDYIDVKDRIKRHYDMMCELIRAHIEEEKRVNLDESMR